MTTLLLPWISFLLSSTPAAPTMTTAEGVPLRAHILEMEGIQWRADLLDGLEYVGQGDGNTVWMADATTVKRLVGSSAYCQPAGTANGLASGGRRVNYVASLELIAQVSKGRTTSLAFKPAVGNVLDGVELDMKGVSAPGGILADVTIRNGRVEAIHIVRRREEIGNGSSIAQLVGTFQVPEVRHGTANGRWLIPSGGAIVVGLGVHGNANIPWGQETRRERVVVIDAGDVPASSFARTPPSHRPVWVSWLAAIGWPALLTALLGTAFLAGWYVRGHNSRARGWSLTGAETETNGRSGVLANEPTSPVPFTEQEPGDGRSLGGSQGSPTLADAMALVAGTAVACCVLQTSVGTLDPSELWDSLINAPASSWTALNVAMVIAELGAVLVAPMLAVGSATLALIVLCMPRPDRFQHLRRPGVMACVQVGLVVVVTVGLELVRYGVGDGSTPAKFDDFVRECTLYVSGLSGLAVASCWITMMLIGVWRPEASWADRLGRLLGMAWIATLPFVLLLAIVS